MKFKYDGGEQFLFNQEIFFRTRNLGVGSFGEVFCFASKNSTTHYAVKCETPHHGRYALGYYFEREANWYEKYYGIGFLSGNPNNNMIPHYILMPYFEGQSLYHLPYPSLKHVVFNWVWAAVAIDTLHTRHNAVHGDVKTNNFIAGYEMHLIDFGFTTEIDHYRPVGFPEEDSSCLYHQAPELFTSNAKRKRADISQDIYSLGVLLRDMYVLFMTADNNHTLNHEQREKIDLVIDNLSTSQPEYRWSIAKGIFMLVTGYLTYIPRGLWNDMTQQDFSHKTKNVAERMPIFCNKILCSSIKVRIEELVMEKRILHSSDRNYRTKEQKIIGLLTMKRALKNLSIATIDIIDAAKRDEKLTTGFFQHKTKDMLCEMDDIARGFQQLY